MPQSPKTMKINFHGATPIGFVILMCFQHFINSSLLPFPIYDIIFSDFLCRFGISKMLEKFCFYQFFQHPGQDRKRISLWEKSDRLYFIIDEAHRGMQGREASRATTIMQKFIKGSEDDGIPPMPVVIGMSATTQRSSNYRSAGTTCIYIETESDATDQ